jgi:hypothetical protein
MINRYLLALPNLLITIESLFGKIPNVHLHGNISKVIFEFFE